MSEEARGNRNQVEATNPGPALLPHQLRVLVASVARRLINAMRRFRNLNTFRTKLCSSARGFACGHARKPADPNPLAVLLFAAAAGWALYRSSSDTRDYWAEFGYPPMYNSELGYYQLGVIATNEAIVGREGGATGVEHGAKRTVQGASEGVKDTALPEEGG